MVKPETSLNFDVEVRARARASARARARARAKARAKVPHVKNSGGGMPPEFLTLPQVIPTSISIPIPILKFYLIIAHLLIAIMWCAIMWYLLGPYGCNYVVVQLCGVQLEVCNYFGTIL